VANYAPFKKQESTVADNNYKVWMCILCGWLYDEAKGAPEEGLAPGTRWEDVPWDWICPDCAAGKEDFEMVEV
jgi:rubredoxin